MSALVVLVVLLAIALLVQVVGVDSRWEGADVRPDRPLRRARRAAGATRVPRQDRRPLPTVVVNDRLSEVR